MNKKVNSIFTGLVFAVFAVFLAAEGAEAFCVYNGTDTEIHFEQTSGGNFYQHISSGGERKCCDWTDTTCNKEGGRQGIVKFDVSYIKFGGDTIYIWKDYKIRAKGYLKVIVSEEGDKGNYKCRGSF